MDGVPTSRSPADGNFRIERVVVAEVRDVLLNDVTINKFVDSVARPPSELASNRVDASLLRIHLGQERELQLSVEVEQQPIQYRSL